MFRLTAYVLAALAMLSFFAVADAQAGNRHERRIHNHQKNVHFKTRRTVRMRSVNASNRYYGNRRISRGTLSFRVDRDRRNGFHRHHRNRYYARYRVNTGNVVIINVDGNRSYRLPVNRVAQRNTYSGDVDVYSVPGVGTYSYGEGSSEVVVTGSAPSATIIDVKTLKPNHACEMQAGVCVIRP
ncbi:hypothetical protein [Rhizobium sp. LjRoot254]|uniref:hypothetical protein n=1 Tax=Rhizobium sp. LjRoot254 TaxID=3342297 RepID=UPI003ED105A0